MVKPTPDPPKPPPIIVHLPADHPIMANPSLAFENDPAVHAFWFF